MSENPDNDVEAAAFLTAFGDELRRARERLGWSREDLVAASGVSVAVSTVAAQELGVRNVTAFELSRYCRALGIESDAVFDEAHRRVLGSSTFVHVDLTALAYADTGGLRMWAQSHIAGLPADAETTVLLTDSSFDDMASQSGMSRADLVHTLVESGAARLATAPREASSSPAPVTNSVVESLQDADVVARWPFLTPIVELPGPPWQFRLMQGGTLAAVRSHDAYAESLWIINETVVGLSRTTIRRDQGSALSSVDFAGSLGEVLDVLRQPVRWEDER
jgi:transcriptional regulator with XRE-family HTH domain